MGKRRGEGVLRYAGKGRGGFVWTKRRELFVKLEGHYESYGGINNTPHKQEESSLQGGSD